MIWLWLSKYSLKPCESANRPSDYRWQWDLSQRFQDQELLTWCLKAPSDRRCLPYLAHCFCVCSCPLVRGSCISKLSVVSLSFSYSFCCSLFQWSSNNFFRQFWGITHIHQSRLQPRLKHAFGVVLSKASWWQELHYWKSMFNMWVIWRWAHLDLHYWKPPSAWQMKSQIVVWKRWFLKTVLRLLW